MGMKIHAECVPCLLKRIVFQAELANNGSEFRATENAVKALAANIGENKRSVDVATEVHTAGYNAMGIDDPYLDLKIRADKVAGNLLPSMEKLVSSSEDHLKTSFLVAVIGNIMDFGIGKAIDDPDDFIPIVEDMLRQGIDENEFDRIRNAIVDSSEVVYMFDNCGESQFDKILIRQLKSLGKRVVGVVRGKEILNDVSMNDALRIGLDKELDSILTTGKFFIGIDWHDIPDELSSELHKGTVIIAKGMANFEASFNENLPVPIIHVLRTKCKPVADSLNAPLGTNVIRLIEPSDSA